MNHDELRKAVSSQVDDTRQGYCLNCDKQTLQTLALYNPDQPTSPKIWECNECLEKVEIENL